MNDATPLPQLAAKLRNLTGTPVPGGYRKLYMMAADGQLPVEVVRGRLFIKNTDLVTVAGLLGMEIQTAKAA